MEDKLVVRCRDAYVELYNEELEKSIGPDTERWVEDVEIRLEDRLRTPVDPEVTRLEFITG